MPSFSKLVLLSFLLATSAFARPFSSDATVATLSSDFKIEIKADLVAFSQDRSFGSTRLPTWSGYDRFAKAYARGQSGQTVCQMTAVIDHSEGLREGGRFLVHSVVYQQGKLEILAESRLLRNQQGLIDIQCRGIREDASPSQLEAIFQNKIRIFESRF